MIFDTKNLTFDGVMGNGWKYYVPKFQRDYAWEIEQWEELWDDLELLEEGEVHYMGYLVLQPDQKDSQSFKIIDGQQRLTTISIMIIAAMKKLQLLIDEGVEPDDSRLKAITRRFVGVENITTMLTEPKLTLNRNNQFHFKNYIASLGKSPGRKLKASNKKLDNALEFFLKKIEKKDLKTGEQIGEFIEDNIKRLLFTIITVDGDLNAYKVFETLNARGVQLSVPDLLKNYMFSVIDDERPQHETEMEDLEETWEHILLQLGSYSFTKFIKTDWDSRNNSIKETQLFKNIKKDISDAKKAFSYLKELKESSGLYAALHNPKDELWLEERFGKAEENIKLLKTFGVTQQNCLLLAAYKKFEEQPEKFVKVVGYLSVMAVRYNLIGGKLPSAQERTYNKIAIGLHKGTVRNLQEIKQGIKEIYPDDEQFLSELQRKKFSSVATKKVRLFLTRIEQYKNEGLDLNDEGVTLEHILPQNPGVGWDHIDDEVLDQYVWRLGNLTILQKSKNKMLGNKPFTEKKNVLSSSPLSVNKHCIQFDDWDEEAIEGHQKWLAKIAVECWKIEF